MIAMVWVFGSDVKREEAVVMVDFANGSDKIEVISNCEKKRGGRHNHLSAIRGFHPSPKRYLMVGWLRRSTTPLHPPLSHGGH